jgi:hypothetical protein
MNSGGGDCFFDGAKKALRLKDDVLTIRQNSVSALLQTSYRSYNVSDWVMKMSLLT